MMAYLTAWWASNGTAFLVGSSCLLTLAALATRLIRSEIGQQRCCEAAVAAVLLWLVLSPMARFLPESVAEKVLLTVSKTTAAAEPLGLSMAGAEAIDWSAWLGFCMLIGCSVLSLYLASAWLLLARLLHHARPAGKGIDGILDSLPLARSSIPVLVSKHAQRPFCCGLFHPRIVLPASCAELSPETLRAVIMHELAHLKQGDLRGRVLFALAMPVLFWNPVFWWLRMRAQLCAELVADDLAAGHLDKGSYVRDLIELAEQLPTSNPRGPVRMAVIEKESEFYRRMKVLIQRRDPITTKCSLTQTIARRVCVLSLVALAACAWTKVPEPDDRIVQRIEVPSDEDAPRVYFNFEDADAHKVFDTIAKIPGINLIISPAASGKVNVRMKNQPWQNALVEVAAQIDCVVLHLSDNIYQVVPRSE